MKIFFTIEVPFHLLLFYITLFIRVRVCVLQWIDALEQNLQGCPAPVVAKLVALASKYLKHALLFYKLFKLVLSSLSEQLVK